MKKEEWIDVYQNDNYLVNIFTGQVKRKDTNKILKERRDFKNKKISYALCKNGTIKYCLAHRIVIYSYHKKEFNDYYILHKDNDYTNNNINNLKISKKKNYNKKYKVIQYKNDVLEKIYDSIKVFMKEAGIDYKTLKKRKGIYTLGKYRFEVPAMMRGEVK